MNIEITINDLPNEILTAIFRNIAKHKDRNKMAAVCHRWSSVIKETIGIRKKIGKPTEFWEDVHPNRWCSLMEIKRVGIDHAIFSELKDTLDFTDASEIRFLLPNLVRKLEFDGFIASEVFCNLSSSLQKLSTLILHLSTLCYLTGVEEMFRKATWSHSLRKLAIASEGFTRKHFSIYDMKQLYNNICSICQSNFPRIKRFESSLPILVDKEIEVFVQLASFVDRHCSTLVDLELRWTERWRLQEGNSNPRTPLELLQTNAELSSLDEYLRGLRDPSTWKLRSIVLLLEDWDNVYPTVLSHREAIFCQTNLEKMYYMCWNYTTVPVGVLRKNADTLTEIGLTVDDIETPLDCGVFSICRNLKRLILQADGHILFDNLASEAPRLQNVQGLPKSLSVLRLRNLYLECESVNWIAKNLPNLNTLVLVNIGRMDNLGMTMACFLWILKYSSTLKVLKVKGINNACFLATFGLNKFSSAPFCPICQVYHDPKAVKVIGASETTSQVDSTSTTTTHEDETWRIDAEDRKLMSNLFSTTSNESKYIPLIEKVRGIWKRSDDYSLLQI